MENKTAMQLLISDIEYHISVIDNYPDRDPDGRSKSAYKTMLNKALFLRDKEEREQIIQMGFDTAQELGYNIDYNTVESIYTTKYKTMELSKETIARIELEAEDKYPKDIWPNRNEGYTAALHYEPILQEYREALEGVMLFIENDGKPVDGFKFRENALAAKQTLLKHK